MKATRTLILSLCSWLIFARSGFFALSAMAQQSDQPDLIQTFPVGDAPTNLAFDGSNIWVTNLGDGTVTKLRASDGAPQGTFIIGQSPQSLTFDGENIWVSSLAQHNLTKLRASDGTVVGSFRVTFNPFGLA